MKYLLIALALVTLAGCGEEERITSTTAKVNYWPVDKVYVDPETGCHYLKAGSNSSFTPRYDAEGKQICRGFQ